MSTTPVLLNSRDHGYITVAPRFEIDDFSSWKDRMLLHLVGIEPYLIDVLTKGPYVPQAPFTGPALANEGEVQMVDKPEAQWTDDERKLVNLDNKLRGIIISTLPTNIMKSVIKLLSAKRVWDTHPHVILWNIGLMRNKATFQDDKISYESAE